MSLRLILGSASPRRKEILSFFSYPFEQCSPHFAEELVPYEGDPIKYADALSRGKALSLVPKVPDAVILTADTVVFKEGSIFNKPQNESEAFSMLESLSGSWHSVFTSVSAACGEKIFTECEETKVLFHPLSKDALKKYHAAFNCLDKAGGYGIQMSGSIIVKRMEGCFYNVMGLPINTLRMILYKVGIDLWHYLS